MKRYCPPPSVRPIPASPFAFARPWLAFVSAVLLACGTLPAAEPSQYPPVRFLDSSGWGRQIQRTMRLLATSTPEQRHSVRILFYGQSITEQQWTKRVEDDLRRRFPHANLIVENRALGGFLPIRSGAVHSQEHAF